MPGCVRVELYAGRRCTGCFIHPRDPSLRAHMRSRFSQDDKGFRKTYTSEAVFLLQDLPHIQSGSTVAVPTSSVASSPSSAVKARCLQTQRAMSLLFNSETALSPLNQKQKLPVGHIGIPQPLVRPLHAGHHVSAVIDFEGLDQASAAANHFVQFFRCCP